MDEMEAPPQLPADSQPPPVVIDPVRPLPKWSRQFPLIPLFLFVLTALVALGIFAFYYYTNIGSKNNGGPSTVEETPASPSTAFTDLLRNSGKVETVNPQPIVTTPKSLPKSENSFYQQLGKNLRNLFP